jgi:hypothetical protein
MPKTSFTCIRPFADIVFADCRPDNRKVCFGPRALIGHYQDSKNYTTTALPPAPDPLFSTILQLQLQQRLQPIAQASKKSLQLTRLSLSSPDSSYFGLRRSIHRERSVFCWPKANCTNIYLEWTVDIRAEQDLTDIRHTKMRMLCQCFSTLDHQRQAQRYPSIHRLQGKVRAKSQFNGVE